MNTLIADERGVRWRCPACGQTNRLLYGALGQAIRCGKCHENLAPNGGPSDPVEPADEAAFAALVKLAAVPVLVDFWAPWCGPCRSVAPEVAQLAATTVGRLLVVKLNTEAFPGVAQTFRIASIPTFVVLRKGQECARQSGALSSAALRQFALGSAR